MGDRSVYRQDTSLVIPIQNIFVHPKFSTAVVVKNDIALLKLQHPVNFTSSIRPVCIPSETFRVKSGTKCWVTGWGKPDPGGKTWLSEGSLALFLGKKQKILRGTRRETDSMGRGGGQTVWQESR